VTAYRCRWAERVLEHIADHSINRIEAKLSWSVAPILRTVPVAA
jgi:hypothetical protein